ncbi:MAG: hypothetical protein ACRD4M_09700, partial [Candidatus Acidiferrales bacterium]
MKNKTIYGLLIMALVFVGVATGVRTLKAKRGRRLTEAETRAVIQAVADEIYDEGCQGYGADAASVQGNGWYQLRMYVSPDMEREKGKNTGASGEIIYK